MSTSTALPAARTALSGLIDYAGLFPPAKLELPPALAEYRAARSGPAAWMLGRFIIPASRLDELGDGETPSLSVIVDAGSDARGWFGNAQRIVERLSELRRVGDPRAAACLEVPLPPLLTQRETYEAAIGQFAMLAERHGLRDLPIYLEMPRDARWLELLPSTMTALARYRLGAKIRCGGVVAEAFPPVGDVAAFLAAARAHGVPFKATAGLHHPLRHVDPATGFPMHGFLNILAGSIFAGRVGLAQLEGIVAEEAAANVRFEEGGLHAGGLFASVEEIAAAREHGFVAYGSCSFSEPVDDLRAMHVLIS
jgi:hypothetical protein